MAGNMIVLRGRIADERTGAPVVGADVKAAQVPSEKASPPYPADGTAVTGQDGRYELRLGYAGPKSASQ
jgi:protocatechuate 3,4-dioxygenase beta subunit